MGLDVCSTFHMGITPQDLRALTRRIALSAAPAYLMAIAGDADPMLGYMTTASREHPRLRSHVRRGTTTAMEQRLRSLGVMSVAGEPSGPTAVAHLYAVYEKAGGDRRAFTALEDEGSRRLSALRDGGSISASSIRPTRIVASTRFTPMPEPRFTPRFKVPWSATQQPEAFGTNHGERPRRLSRSPAFG